ncbi:MAG TPA: hypothetical protein VF143_11475 [Candidatus Nanopelagicales bacterium]
MGRSRQAVGAVVLALALALSGCQRSQPAAQPTPAPPSPSASATGRPARPTAQDLDVAPTRDPVTSVAGRIAIAGDPGALVVDEVAGEAFVVGLPGEALQAIDLASHEVTGAIDLSGTEPLGPRLAADPYGGVLYATRALGSWRALTVIDVASLRVTDVIDVGSPGLWSAAVDPTTGTLYLMEEGTRGDGRGEGDLLVLDGTTRAVLGRIPLDVDESQAGIAVDPVHGRVLVSDWDRGRLLVIDAAALRVETTIQVVASLATRCENCLGGLGSPLVDPGSGLVYLAGPPPAAVVEPPQALAAGTGWALPTGGPPGAVPVQPVGVGASGIYVVDPEAGEVVASATVPDPALGIDPAAGAAYLAGQAFSDGVRSVDVGTLTVSDAIPVAGGVRTLAVDPASGAVWAAAEGGLVVLE